MDSRTDCHEWRCNFDRRREEAKATKRAIDNDVRVETYRMYEKEKKRKKKEINVVVTMEEL